MKSFFIPLGRTKAKTNSVTSFSAKQEVALMFKTRKTNLVLILAVMITILAAFTASAAGISQKRLTLTVGSKETLKVSGAKKVKWSSSNKNIASVSGKGQVKAVKAGTAKITAKAGKKKYTCKVTVIAAKASGAAGNAKSAAAGTAKAMTAKEKEVYKQIMAMKSIYKEGQSWGAKVFYEWDGGIFAGGLGCAAFVFMLSDIAFGSKPARIHENKNDIMVGDCLRVNNDSHFVIVLQKTNTGVVVAEGNYGAKVHWGRTISWKELGKTLDYVVTRY